MLLAAPPVWSSKGRCGNLHKYKIDMAKRLLKVLQEHTISKMWNIILTILHILGYVRLGKSLRNLGKIKEAIIAFKRAAELDPSNSDTVASLESLRELLNGEKNYISCFVFRTFWFLFYQYYILCCSALRSHIALTCCVAIVCDISYRPLSQLSSNENYQNYQFIVF